jgi:hypothetical protein
MTADTHLSSHARAPHHRTNGRRFPHWNLDDPITEGPFLIEITNKTNHASGNHAYRQVWLQ